ncbi:MAG: hypothetical protein M3065_10915, partial [Actinomycetota bacterium]|nr:hypothetical protein [Actinomycetota bacterium]
MSDNDAPVIDVPAVEADEHPYGAAEPLPRRAAQLRVPAWEAVKRHWLIVLLPTLLMLGVGVFVGLARSPEYTSEARLTVGRVDVDPAALAT